MSDARFGSWSAAESPVTIEYSLVVIEEIRHEVAEGFQKLSRGGMEVGGLLYGARDGRTVRILAMRPIACEHARGPAFLLSDSDRKMLKDQLERGEEDPRLKDLICLGWFISHTRSEIMLSEPDLETFGKYFSAPWQVTLVIRPGRGGSMRAGFSCANMTARFAATPATWSSTSRIVWLVCWTGRRAPIDRPRPVAIRFISGKARPRPRIANLHRPSRPWLWLARNFSPRQRLDPSGRGWWSGAWPSLCCCSGCATSS